MSVFAIHLDGDWLGGTENVLDATFGALRITAEGTPLTEVSDTIAKTTRTSIRVPTILLAEWLVSRWWRLRWEARPERMSGEWRSAHSMAAIDSGIPWPPLEVSCDGELLGLAIDLGQDQRILPVSGAATATQKFGRAFGQEFLCPWEELDAFTDENGTSEDAIARAAERWEVSEMLVTTTLVNRGKVERGQLARFGS